MLSMFGAIIGYVMLGLAESLWVIGLSRLLSGLMSGNIAAAQAYMTDITSEDDRAKANDPVLHFPVVGETGANPGDLAVAAVAVEVHAPATALAGADLSTTALVELEAFTISAPKICWAALAGWSRAT